MGKRPAGESSQGGFAQRRRKADGDDGSLAGGDNMVVPLRQNRHGGTDSSGGGGGQDAVGSGAEYAMTREQRADADESGGMNGGNGGVTAQTRKRRLSGAMGGEMAVKRFVAFATGARVERVVMVSGVQVIAGERKRPRRGERAAARRQRRRRDTHDEGRRDDASWGGGGRDDSDDRDTDRVTDAECLEGPGASAGVTRDEDERGSGGWGPGGLGDRTGVG